MGMETNKQREHDIDMLKREQRFNATQAQIAYDRQKEFYNYQFQNESNYNSPLSQMQRYKAAGLNPYLLAGSGGFDSGNTGVSASSPSSASASGSASNLAGFQNNTLSALANIASTAQGLYSLSSQVDLNKSQEVKNYADAEKTAGVDTENTRADTKLKTTQSSNVAADTELKREERANVAADTRRLNYMVDKFLPKQYDEIAKRIEDLGSQIWQRQQITPAEVAKFRQEVAESISRMHLNEATESKINKEIEYFDERVCAELNISEQTYQQMLSNNSLLKLQNGIAEDILNTNDVNGLWNNSQFRNNIYKLRALQFLTPSPGLDSYQQGANVFESFGRGYNLFFGGKSGQNSIKGFLK